MTFLCLNQSLDEEELLSLILLASASILHDGETQIALRQRHNTFPLSSLISRSLLSAVTSDSCFNLSHFHETRGDAGDARLPALSNLMSN